MRSRFHKLSCAAALAALAALSSQALAQSDDGDPELRIQRLEEQLRQLTGQNEELQYRNRQLEQQLRQLQGGMPAAPGQPGVAAASPTQPAPGYGQPQVQPGYSQPQGQPGYAQSQIPAPAPIIQEPSTPVGGATRRGDAFDPSQNPNAPGAPRALGGGQLPIQAGASVGAPGGRAPGEPLDLGATRYQQGNVAAAPPVGPGGTGLATAPPSNSPRDEYDLGIGYMQRRDYALAEQTMRNFAQRFPTDPLVGDSQYWLGESYFQRQQYRDAAEAFLAVTTKYEKSSKAPDALLRLGQSLAALKEKEAACAAFGEVMRKYPRASTGVKAAVDREQKKEKC
ncbi:tol-pal system protein YbgF [Bradyrhizobium sp. STM 3562]|uniref:tol-pal system protein YbgF n=1 Tax=Bradyrhizobium sp. STM 3562 TaxID=578924 RepID=UPI00388FD346